MGEKMGNKGFDHDDPRFNTLFMKARRAPCTPSAFRKVLSTLHFTNGSDRAFVMKKYSQTFAEVMASAEELDYSIKLKWGDEEAKDVAEALLVQESQGVGPQRQSDWRHRGGIFGTRVGRQHNY